MDPKVRGIVAYITLIGWLIAVVTNNPKDALASFHIRQMLGLMLASVALSFAAVIFMLIPFLGWLIALACWLANVGILVLWVMGFIGALQGEQKSVPLVGDQFQQWFQAL